MVVFLTGFVFESNGQRNTLASFINEIAMIDPVVFAIKRNPKFSFETLRIIEIIDHTFR